jgi:hypothetical protein
MSMFTSHFNDYTLIVLQKEFYFPCYNLLHRSGLIISSCTITLFTCLFMQNTIIVVSYRNNKDYSQSVYIFKFYHSGFFLLFIAQLQKMLIIKRLITKKVNIYILKESQDINLHLVFH